MGIIRAIFKLSGRLYRLMRFALSPQTQPISTKQPEKKRIIAVHQTQIIAQHQFNFQQRQREDDERER
jgi:hypothetical protein